MRSVRYNTPLKNALNSPVVSQHNVSVRLARTHTIQSGRYVITDLITYHVRQTCRDIEGQGYPFKFFTKSKAVKRIWMDSVLHVTGLLNFFICYQVP